MGDFVELRQYVSIVLKRWWVIALALIVTVALGYGYTQRQPRIYEATASILVGQSIQATDVNRAEIQVSEQLAETYAALARREPVLQGAVEELGLDTNWQSLRGRISAKIVPGTQLVEVTVAASSPEEAHLIANEVARQLVLLSPTNLQNQESSQTTAFINQRLETLQAKIEDGQQRLEELEATDVTGLSADEVAQLEDEINTIQNLISDWDQNYAQLLAYVDGQQSANYLKIIEEAQGSSKPKSPNIQLNMMVSVVIGLALGLALAFILEHLDDTVKVTDDMGQLFGVIPLGAVRKSRDKEYSKALITSQDRFSPDSEAYRMIRSNIQFMSVDGPGKSMLVTSAVRGEGKSRIVANLGVVLAQAGLKTIIVDTDLRRPVQQEIFDLPNQNGLTELLRKPNLAAGDFLANTHVPGLQVLTSGVLPPNPSELVGSQRMRQVMVELSEIADMVIYDSPPVVIVADAAILAKQVAGVVLVVEVDKTRRDVVNQAVFNLQQAEANVYGVVLNRVSKKRHSYYYQGYYYKQDVDGRSNQTGHNIWRRWLRLSR